MFKKLLHRIKRLFWTGYVRGHDRMRLARYSALKRVKREPEVITLQIDKSVHHVARRQ